MKKLIPILILILILLLGFIFYYTNKINNTSDKNGISTSSIQAEYSSSINMTSSLTMKSTQSTQQISVTLNKPSIDERKPYTNEISKFNSIISENNNVNIKITNPAIALISFPKYSIIVKEISEEFPPNRIYNSNDIKVNSSFSKIVYRLDYSNDSDSNSYFKSLNLNYNYYYFYTTQLSPNCPIDFPVNKYCGESIILYNNEKKLSTIFTVSCLTNDKANILKCDEFIQNLKVLKNEIKLF